MPNDLPHFVVLENASNLRDLGGYPVGGGGRTRFGRVFRAPALVALSPADEAAIAALGIKITCDFRGERESEALPVILPGARVEKLPIEPSVGAGLKDILRTGVADGDVTPQHMYELLREAYEAYALTSFDRYRSLFALLGSDDNLPLLFHCSAGKDRTGFGAALLLTTLGVDWPHVVQDYLATNDLWRREIARNFEMPDPILNTLLSAHEGLLTAAFDAVRREYGSIDAYLVKAIGLSSEARADLQNRLTH
jgi:protein-tyrosine phosphatase